MRRRRRTHEQQKKPTDEAAWIGCEGYFRAWTLTVCPCKYFCPCVTGFVVQNCVGHGAGSGKIDPDEVNIIMEIIFGSKLPDRQLQVVMAEMDPDGGGLVDFSEFARWCEKPLPKHTDKQRWWVVAKQDVTVAAGHLHYKMSRLLVKQTHSTTLHHTPRWFSFNAIWIFVC